MNFILVSWKDQICEVQCYQISVFVYLQIYQQQKKSYGEFPFLWMHGET